MAQLNVGVIGCGRIAELVHLNTLQRLENVALVALADSDSERLKKAALRAPSARTFSEYHDLLNADEVQAVVICVPNALHAETALAAFERRKHVYLEKPLATNLDDARALREAWRAAGVVGMIGFNFRFSPLYESLRRCVLSGQMGELVAARSVFSTQSSNLPEWKQALGTGGGILMDYGTHHVDLARFLLGQEIRRVFARQRSDLSEGDSAILELELTGGLFVQAFFSARTIEEDTFEIYSHQGKWRVDRRRSIDVEKTTTPSAAASLRTMTERVKGLVRPQYLRRLVFPTHETSYELAMRHFVSCAIPCFSKYPGA